MTTFAILYFLSPVMEKHLLASPDRVMTCLLTLHSLASSVDKFRLHLGIHNPLIMI